LIQKHFSILLIANQNPFFSSNLSNSFSIWFISRPNLLILALQFQKYHFISFLFPSISNHKLSFRKGTKIFFRLIFQILFCFSFLMKIALQVIIN
jgi:hypothetical protein